MDQCGNKRVVTNILPLPMPDRRYLVKESCPILTSRQEEFAVYVSVIMQIMGEFIVPQGAKAVQVVQPKNVVSCFTQDDLGIRNRKRAVLPVLIDLPNCCIVVSSAAWGGQAWAMATQVEQTSRTRERPTRQHGLFLIQLTSPDGNNGQHDINN